MVANQVPSELLREVIREVVRDVLKEVIAEEISTAMHSGAIQPASRAAARTTTTAATKHQVTRGPLTERQVRAAELDGSTIWITRRVVVTPLARERAKLSGIDIIRIEE